MESALACFVTPHGFGHAARCSAVLQALVERRPSVRLHIFTTVPEWFFHKSIGEIYDYHLCTTDVGLVQVSPLVEDLRRTAVELECAPWRDESAMVELEGTLAGLGCTAVISDISPFGLRLARRMGLPSVLLENFTWDWIYRNLARPAVLEDFAEELAGVFASADLHIQASPACLVSEDAVRVDPVARAPRKDRDAIRRELRIPRCDEMVLASMGGVGWCYGNLEGLAAAGGPWFVVPGGAAAEERRGRLILLPFHSDFHHPDLVQAADVVLGKLGYSTVAEAVHGGTAFAYVERPRFPESPILAEFVERHLTAAKIAEEGFACGDWMPVVGELLSGARKKPRFANGADQAARIIIERFPEVFG